MNYVFIFDIEIVDEFPRTHQWIYVDEQIKCNTLLMYILSIVNVRRAHAFSIDFSGFPRFNGNGTLDFLKGPKDGKGDTGPQGPPGLQDEQGPKGQKGDTGATGL